MDAPTVRERTARRATSGAPRAARQGRALDRRTALSSVAAELSAAAAFDDLFVARPAPVTAVAVAELPAEEAAPSVLDRLAALDDVDAERAVVPVRETHAAPVEVFLTGRRGGIPDWEGGPVPGTTPAPAPAAPHAVAALPAIPKPPVALVREPATPHVAMPEPALADTEPAATAPAAPVLSIAAVVVPSALEDSSHLDADELRALVQLEAARAEAEVLSTRMESAHAARAEAERRLAEMEDELRFLRAEVQMAGHSTKRREPSPLRRTLRALTGRRRPVVPANNPKKERLGI